MRLLFVLDSLGSGGAQRQMVGLARGLHQRGHEIEFFVYYPQYKHFLPLIAESGIKVHSCPKKSRFSPSVVSGLRRVLKSGRHDAVLSFLSTPNFYAAVSRIRTPVRALVVSERSAFPKGRLPWQVRFLKQFHRLADHIVVNSFHQRERLVREFPWMGGRISTIVNGVDHEAFGPRRSRPGSGVSRLSLLAVGRIGPEKNAARLIEALALYRELRGVPPRVRWAGRWDDSPSGREYRKLVERLLAETGLGDSWEWLGERSDVAELLAESDALIHPSLYEGFPNAVCEAFAAARPVLLSNVCDHPRLVQDGVRGFLFDPEKPREIADAIHRFRMLSEPVREAMGEEARSYSEAELSMNAVLDRYEQLFVKLTAPARPHRHESPV